MKDLVIQGDPWLTTALAALYLGITIVFEVMRDRVDPDQERSRQVQVYFVNALTFGVTAGFMFAHHTDNGQSINRFWMILGLVLYFFGAYGAGVALKWVPTYDRILMLAGGVSCLLYLCFNNTWYPTEVSLVGIAMLVVAVTLVVRAAEGWIRFLLVPLRQAHPQGKLGDPTE